MSRLNNNWRTKSSQECLVILLRQIKLNKNILAIRPSQISSQNRRYNKKPMFENDLMT